MDITNRVSHVPADTGMEKQRNYPSREYYTKTLLLTSTSATALLDLTEGPKTFVHSLVAHNVTGTSTTLTIRKKLATDSDDNSQLLALTNAIADVDSPLLTYKGGESEVPVFVMEAGEVLSLTASAANRIVAVLTYSQEIAG